MGGPGDSPHYPGMDRRRFLLTSLAGAVATPRAAEAQHADRNARIGYLSLDLGRRSPHPRGLHRWIA